MTRGSVMKARTFITPPHWHIDADQVRGGDHPIVCVQVSLELTLSGQSRSDGIILITISKLRATELAVVLNWFSGLERLAPTGNGPLRAHPRGCTANR